MKKIEAYLQALQAGEYKDELVWETMKRLNDCGPQELSDNRLLVAAVYYKLLQYCQELYQDKIPDHIKKELLTVFENIEQIGVEATQEEREDSSLITIWFLHELKLHRESGDFWRVDDERLQQSIDILLRDLNTIHFIFEIKEDGHYVFPINVMIAKVVEKKDFISSGTPLCSYHIHILQLAVKLFVDNEDEQKILQVLLNRCNLKFINYLNVTGYMVDTPDLLNHQKNSVMIFYDREKSRVLIRHESEEYFSPEPIWMPEKNMNLEREYDYKGKSIGAFVEYTLDKRDSLVDYSELLKTETGREEFLKLVFDKGAFNILVEGTIIHKIDGSYLPINPYCHHDEFIVKGRRNGNDGKIYDREQLLKALNKFRSSALRISRSCILNCVSFGLAVLLLQNENTGVNSLGLHEFLEDDWYQNQMIRKWSESCKNPLEALKFVTEQWYRENEYCGGLASSYKKIKEKYQNQRVEALDFYPLKSDIGWIYQMLGGQSSKDWYILRGKMREEEDGQYILKVDLETDASGKRFIRDMGRDRLAVKIEDLEDEDKVIDDEWGEQEYYILYDGRHQTGKVCEQLLLKMISGIENLQENSSLDLKTASKISVNNYRELTSLMSLFKQEFEQMCKRFFCDFDSQVYYRLIHNMIWSNVDESKVDSYFRIFLHHQKLTFEEIEEDEKFMRKGKNILYVPKEGREGDGTLRSIYEKYLKSKGRRETRDLYDGWLELREDGYYHDNSRINHIIFLCDNFECGTAAVRMLRAYLDIGTNDITDIEKRKREEKELEKVKFRLHKYYLKESASVGAAEESTQTEGKVSQVFLKDVIEKNGCMVEVYGYYGTKEGQNVIDSFLKEQGIAFVPSTFKRRIFSKASQIEKDVQCIWPKMKCGDFYTVVREFNMTKVNVFPPEMLDNPEKAICMFVKKIELSTTR